MHIGQLRESSFLKKEDCGQQGILVTMDGVRQENVAKEGAPQELKWCLYLKEAEKPVVLNSTNAQLIAQIAKSEETDNWPGHKIVLYHDPSVSFAGKIVGGIRVRAPRGRAAAAVAANPAPAPAPVHRPAPAPAPVAAPEPEEDDGDVPF